MIYTEIRVAKMRYRNPAVGWWVDFIVWPCSVISVITRSLTGNKSSRMLSLREQFHLLYTWP